MNKLATLDSQLVLNRVPALFPRPPNTRMRQETTKTGQGANSQTNAGLANLTKQVVDIIPRSRIDTPEPRRTKKVCLGTVPMESPHDFRSRLIKRKGVEEVRLGTVPMESQESSQESSQDEGTNVRPKPIIPLWETQEAAQSEGDLEVTDKMNTYLGRESRRKRGHHFRRTDSQHAQPDRKSLREGENHEKTQEKSLKEKNLQLLPKAILMLKSNLNQIIETRQA
jgi:hypothetical protein